MRVWCRGMAEGGPKQGRFWAVFLIVIDKLNTLFIEFGRMSPRL